MIWFVAEKKINILEKQRYKEFHIIGFGCLLSALWPTIFLVVLLLFLCFTWPFCCCCCWLVCVYRIYVAFHIRWNNNKNVTTSSRLKKRSNEEKKTFIVREKRCRMKHADKYLQRECDGSKWLNSINITDKLRLKGNISIRFRMKNPPTTFSLHGQRQTNAQEKYHLI